MNKTVYLYICHGVLFIIGYLMREWAFPVVTLKHLNKPIMEHTAYKLFLLFCCIFVQIKSVRKVHRDKSSTSVSPSLCLCCVLLWMRRCLRVHACLYCDLFNGDSPMSFKPEIKVAINEDFLSLPDHPALSH